MKLYNLWWERKRRVCDDLIHHFWYQFVPFGSWQITIRCGEFDGRGRGGCGDGGGGNIGMVVVHQLVGGREGGTEVAWMIRLRRRGT